MVINGFLWQKQSNFYIKRCIQWTLCNEKFLGIDEIPPLLDQSFKTANKLKRELTIYIQSLPLMKLSSWAVNINVKSREAYQNTDLDMQKFLY